MSNVITPVFRVSYPKVFTPEKNDLNGKMEYTLTALFKKGEDLSTLKKAAEEACEKKWSKDKAKWPKNLKNPFRDQAEKEKEIEIIEKKKILGEDGLPKEIEVKTVKRVMPDGYEKGAFFLNIKSSQRPGVVDQNVQDIIDPVDFYGGCYARASVQASAYDIKGNKGVSFWMQNVQKTSDGESFGGRLKPQEDFEPIAAAGESNGIFD